MATNVRDPRSIITPDAFGIAPSLLGTPLATPGRRLGAMLVDLVVIGILNAVTASISLVLWGAVALFFIVMALRAPGRTARGQVSSLLFRGATGCLGVSILIGVLIAYLVVRSGGDAVESLARGAVQAAAEAEGLPAPPDEIELGDFLEGLASYATLREVEDPDEAVVLVARMLEAAGGAELGPEQARGLLDGTLPDDVPWAADRDSVYARAFRSAGIGAPPPEPAETVEAEDVSGWSDEEALARFADLHSAAAEGTLSAADEATYQALRARVAGVVASDTLEALADRIDDVEDDLARSERRLADAREELDAGESGFGALLRDIWDQAGSAIGLWSLYFTVILTLTGGRTVGKKLFGLKVLRLDGEPLTWWSSFERAGGYVAGIATGTLGFVQVFWDPNRQCVHDKIVGTVVVVDGAAIEPGAWQEAWTAAPEADPR